jgi:hypothetical protein
MNEKEWLTSTNPLAMLTHIDPPGPPQASLRKLRLFVAACLRLNGLEKVAAAAEQFADDGDELALMDVWRTGRPPIAFGTVAGTRIYAADLAAIGQTGPRAHVLRCIFNPFRTVPGFTAAKFDGKTWHEPSDWLTPDVLVLAQTIYQDRAWELMPILGDAAEGAGCTDEAILRYLHGWVRCLYCLGDRPGSLCQGCGDQLVRPMATPGTGWVRHRCPADCVIPIPSTDGIYRLYESGEPGGRWVKCSTCKGTGHAPAIHCRGDWVLDLFLGKG